MLEDGVGASDCVNAVKSSVCMLYIGENLVVVVVLCK